MRGRKKWPCYLCGGESDELSLRVVEIPRGREPRGVCPPCARAGDEEIARIRKERRAELDRIVAEAIGPRLRRISRRGKEGS